ncbi:MAG: hypothetical protein HXY46_15095 [Syntrophaceae bacterium]|nr:hypothetical protein [Syntrophaceae bacterium]
MDTEAQQKRDRIILEMVRELLLSEVAFQEIFKRYKEGRLRFSDIGNWVDDKGEGPLYNLKEKSHSLYRQMGKEVPQEKEWILDLAIGSIFHEAMKLRENIYQIEVYRPKYLQFKQKTGKSAYEKDYLERFERIISRAEQGVADGMEEMRSLFHDAMTQLIDFFKEHANDPFLVRFLIEHQTVLRKVYGPKKVKEIFDQMFEKGLLEAYHLAGRSYLQSGHYDLSALCFSKARRMDAEHPDLRFFQNLSLGMQAYYDNLYPKALACFTKLVNSNSKASGKKDYLRRVEEVCSKISSELREGRNLRGARKASSLADRIRKML